MRFRYVIASSLTALAVAGCNPADDLDQLRTTQATGSPFTQALSRGYLAFAESEREQYDWRDAEHFAKKGLAANSGNAIEPEAPERRGLGRADNAEVHEARQRLVSAIATARDAKPAAAARAQVNYDCWVEQLEEAWQVEHIAACRRDFLAAMNELEARPVAAAPPPAPARPSPIDRYQVYFEFDSAQVSQTARDIIRQAAQEAQQTGARSLVAVGHADRAGPPDYNDELSARRAAAVAEVVRQSAGGGARMDVQTAAVGESEPLVATPDGVPEPQNRRVVIRFQ